MDNQNERIERLLDTLQSRMPWLPQIGLVLGSGLGDYISQLHEVTFIQYDELPGFPLSTVQGHAGRFVLGTCNGCRVMCMQGRFHYYEGYDMNDVVLPIRAMARLGIEKILLTNAAGGVNTSFEPGDLMVIKDHIAIMTPNSLRGPNIDTLGPRFVDMSRAYDPALSNLLRESGRLENVELREGIYAMTAGPTYETPAEIRMWRMLGADAVGMSTAPEVIAAVHAGMRVAAVSCITNMAAGVLDQPLSHEEVMKTADKSKDRFTRLVNGFLTLAMREQTGERGL